MTDHPVIIFDGICNFCNGAVNFIIKRDPKGVFVFTPMQSDIAKNLIAQYEAPKIGYDTFLLIKNGSCYYRTDAAFEITKDLTGFWYLFRLFKIFPRVIRDFFYRLFARNRYAIFGRKKQCMVPNEALKNRFL